MTRQEIIQQALEANKQLQELVQLSFGNCEAKGDEQLQEDLNDFNCSINLFIKGVKWLETLASEGRI
ncbi:hypothetical protein [Calothrix sp. NIES-2098]|uniref:hypothetical protein n=1 Tax=Calothrix sp. NIES-2098 TaxID=1954171 RepID=UPI000B5E4BDB|nr:hypothetical protein NIES2098_47270 [Calothrix sp. NIES-2098]